MKASFNTDLITFKYDTQEEVYMHARKLSFEALDLLNNAARFETMSKLHNPYGDGKACERIVEFIAQQEGKTIQTETLVN